MTNRSPMRNEGAEKRIREWLKANREFPAERNDFSIVMLSF
jgi:hypothetical protein